MRLLHFGLITISCIVLIGCQSPKEKQYSALELQQLEFGLDSLYFSEDEAVRAQLKSKLLSFKESDNELLLNIVAKYHYDGISKDSLAPIQFKEEIRARFPNGVLARNAAMYQGLDTHEDMNALKAWYDEWKSKFPPENYDDYHINVYNETLGEVVYEAKLLEDDNKVEQLAKEFIDAPNLGMYYLSVSQYFQEKEQYILQEKFAALALESAEKWIAKEDFFDLYKTRIYNTRNDALLALADAKRRQENYKSAYENYSLLLEKTNPNFLNTSEQTNYAAVLCKVEKSKEALDVVEKLLKEEGPEPSRLDMFKDIYLSVYPNDINGFNKKITTLKANFSKQVKAEIKELLIKKEMPDFVLKDFDGKRYDNASLKGKIIVLDLWAPWCWACIEGFPGMKLANAHYKNDPNVEFFFVNTLDGNHNSITKAQKDRLVQVMQKNNVPEFKVLLDQYNEDINKALLAQSLGIESIPQKIVLDKDGKIRFIVEGILSEPYKESQELITMVETLKAMP